MVWIGAFGRLVFQPTVLVLAAEDRVGLNGFLPAQPVTVHVCVALRCDVEQFKRRTLPKVVAAIDELVDAAV